MQRVAELFETITSSLLSWCGEDDDDDDGDDDVMLFAVDIARLYLQAVTGARV
ncbi:hypothetical protein QTP88_021753 [Uroleucon formosanum]